MACESAAAGHADAFDVEEFLCKYGLSEYAAKFVEEGYDSLEVLRVMSDEDMCHCGVKRGHMLKIRLAATGRAQVVHPIEPGQNAIFRDAESEADGSEVLVVRRDPAQKGRRVVRLLKSGEELTVRADQLFMPKHSGPPPGPGVQGLDAAWSRGQPAGVRVKNTFIECDEDVDSDGEQPDYRKIASTPANFSSPADPPTPTNFASASTPVARFGGSAQPEYIDVGPSAPPGLGGTERHQGAPLPARVPVSVPRQLPLSQSAVPQFPPRPPGILASQQESGRRESHVLVKNTFINVSDETDDDDEEQPSYRPCASSPATVAGVRRLSSGNTGAARAPAGAAAGAPAPAAAVASVGSSGHPGECRPCAHIWKPTGCSKGVACTFCHLCTEEDFKEGRRAKINRLKAQKAQQREEAAVATADVPAAPARPQGGDPPLELAQEAGGASAASGELTAVSEGAGWSVQWAVDLHRLRTKNRCGDAKSFTLPLHGRQVQFRLFLRPAEQSEGGGGRASFGKDSQLASVMLKCTDAGSVQPGSRVSVAFAAGGLPRRWASQSHDFAAEPVCAPHEREPPWDLAAAADGAGKCVLRAVVTPVSEQ